MNVRRIVLLNVVAFIVVLAAVYGGYSYYYQQSHYVTTNNAFIEGQVVPLNAEFAGKLSSWNVMAGDQVAAGQVVGQLDTSLEKQQLGVTASAPGVAQAVSNAAQIMSPTNGTVVQSNVSAGQLVSPGQPLGEVVNLSNLHVTANINETELRNINVGDTVDISVDSYPSLSLKGTVQSIGMTTNSFFALIPSTNNASGTYTRVTQTVPVRISMSGYAGTALRPGMSVTVRIHRQTP